MKVKAKSAARSARDNLLSPRTLMVCAALLAAFPLAYVALPDLTGTTYDVSSVSAREATSTPPQETVEHVGLPRAVKAIYMTSCVVGSRELREGLADLIGTTELNAVVIDIKDYSGTISFNTDEPALMPAISQKCGASDMREFVKTLHERNIYVIGRITVFQDPYYSRAHPELAVKKSDGSVWTDYKGLSFIDVGAQPYWDYIVKLSRESFNLGFDELNFDYVRFPSDGNMKDIYFSHSLGKSKAEALESFFAYLSRALRDPSLYEKYEHRTLAAPLLSVDLFGMTTTNTDDLNIGQVLERALPYFDFIAPMVYPSHYPKGFHGWQNPNHYPYEVVYYSMKTAADRAVATSTPAAFLGAVPIASTTPALYEKPAFSAQKLRPWLQDFDYGGEYDVPEVQAQIRATYDAGLTSWMLWSPSNRYTRGALLDETASTNPAAGGAGASR